MGSRLEIPDSDSDFSDDDELPSLDALFKTQPRSSGAAGTVFSKSAKVASSDPLKSEDNREEKWAEFMELIQEGEEDDDFDAVPQAAPRPSRRPSTPSEEAGDSQNLFDHAVNLVKGGGSDDEDMNSDEDQHWARIRQAMDRQSSTRSAPVYYFFKETEDTDEEVVKCRCGSTEDIGYMVECETCKTWQHIKCYYPNNQKEARQPGFAHRCDDCKPPPQLFLQYAHETLKPARPRHFSLALHTKLSTKFSSSGAAINLPDELLVWIMRAFPIERHEQIREEYSRILLDYPKRVRDLVDEDQVKRWFLRSGALDEAVTLRAKGKAVKQRHSSLERNWLLFQNVLGLLKTCCGSFRTDALVCAVVLLLRTSMDGEVRVNATISTAVMDTLVALTAAVHETRREYFCEKVCEYFIPSIESGFLLSRAVEATQHFSPELFASTGNPETFSPSRDLRIRLQLAVFFHSASNYHHLPPIHLLESILDRLEDAAFKARPGARGDINFYDLDGYGLALSELLPYIHLLRSREKDKEKLKEIDELINIMRRKVNWINNTVQIQGPQGDYDARYEAKSRYTYLDQRMSYFFPRRDGGIFGDEREASERRALKSGQEFMAGFINKRKEVPKEVPVSPKKELEARPLVIGSPRKLKSDQGSLVTGSPRKLKSGPEFMAGLSNKRKAAPEPEPGVRKILFEPRKSDGPMQLDGAKDLEKAKEPDEVMQVDKEPELPKPLQVAKEPDEAMQVDREPELPKPLQIGKEEPQVEKEPVAKQQDPPKSSQEFFARWFKGSK